MNTLEATGKHGRKEDGMAAQIFLVLIPKMRLFLLIEDKEQKWDDESQPPTLGNSAL